MTGPDLAVLLAERPQDARERARTTWPGIAGDRPVVLYGAGGVGRRVLAALRKAGREPLCFADGGVAAGTTADDVDGLPVLSLADAAARHGAGAVFVITILNPRFAFTALRDALLGAGCERVCSWIPLAWAHADALLPYYAVDLPERVLEQAGAVRAAHALLSDMASRAEFTRQVAWRLTGDFDLLGPHRPVAEQYFAPDVLTLRPEEVFVDCGAFDGDTVASLLAHAPAPFAGEVLALEPDPANLRALHARLDGLDGATRERIEVLPVAAARERATVRFGGGGRSSAGITGDGEIEVAAAPLDELLSGRDRPPTYVKMDIEGAERDALAGVTATVRSARPALALCAYHVQDHLWQLALDVDALVDGYSYAMRRYEPDCWEVVLYAIPLERRATL